MLRRIDLRGDRADPTARLRRATEERMREARRSARQIVEAVRTDGDEAIARFARQFDGFTGGPLEVPEAEMKAALAELDPVLRKALERAADRIQWFHQRAKPQSWRAEKDGVVLGVDHHPVRRAGVYIPGGLTALPSTVLMTVVPARVAGVTEIVLCTPPGRDGQVNQTILAAAALMSVDRVYRIGGAQAVAAMAFGTKTVPRCDLVCGPGNVYVAEAKLLVAGAGACGIDGYAGTTEVAVIADATADPSIVAADLVAQAEHDPLVTALLITPSEDLIAAVDEALVTEVAAARHQQRIRQALEGQGAAVLVDDLDQAVEVADAFAAEHLEVQTEDAAAVAARVRAAGTIFVGPWAPVALGDYAAGPNHTLPTGGTARFAGGLSTSSFMIAVNWIEASEPALTDLAPIVDALSAAEDLPAHARSVRLRLGRDDDR